MAQRPLKSGGKSADDEDELDLPPAPDRTRVEASPFVEGAQPPPRPPKKPVKREVSNIVVVDELKDEPKDEGREWSSDPAIAPRGPAKNETRLARPAADAGDDDGEDFGFQEPERREVHDPNATVERPSGRHDTGLSDDLDLQRSETSELAQAGGDRDAPSSASDEDATSAGPPVTLEITAGPDAGVKKRVRGGRMIIGRGDGCDLQLLDGSVSRRHVEIVVSSAGLVLRDLGSGNGTRVNGKKVPEAALTHGDKISIGQTVISIVDELKRMEERRAEKEKASSHSISRPLPKGPPKDDAFEPAPKAAPPVDAEARKGTVELSMLPPSQRRGGGLQPKHKLALGVGGALIVVVLVFRLVASVARPSTPEPDKAAAAAQTQTFAVTVQEAKNLLAKGKYEESLAKFREAQALDPSKNLDVPLQVAETEVAAAHAIAAAKSAAQNGRWDDALVELAKIKQESMQWDGARQLTDEYEAERVKARGGEIRAALAEGNFDHARELLVNLPDNLRPAMTAEINDGEQKAAREAEQQRAQAVRAAARQKQARIRAAQAEVDAALAGVTRKIDSASFDGALKELDHVGEESRSDLVQKKAKLVRKKLPDLAKAWNEGTAKFEAGAYEISLPLLTRALSVWEDMDVAGSLDEKLKPKIAKATLEKGRASYQRQEYGAAIRALKEALGSPLKSSDANDAREMLTRISSKAHDVYMEGYVMRERDPEVARRKFRDVMEMVPPTSEDYVNAKRRLEALDK